MSHWPEWLSTKREEEKFHFPGAVFSDVPFPIPNQHCYQRSLQPAERAFPFWPPLRVVGADSGSLPTTQRWAIYTNLQWKVLLKVAKSIFFFPSPLSTCGYDVQISCFHYAFEMLRIWSEAALHQNYLWSLGNTDCQAQPQIYCGRISRDGAGEQDFLCELPDIYISLGTKTLRNNWRKKNLAQW